MISSLLPLATPTLTVVQNAYIVRNLETTCARWRDLYGIGPFLGGERVVLDQHVYRGKPAAPIELRAVFVQSGALNLELIELVSPGPSAFHDMMLPGSEGFHHVAMFCEDYVAVRDRFAAAGWPVASEFTMSFGAQICYIDAREGLGHMIELYPKHPVIRDMYAQALHASQTGLGAGLIQPFVWR